MEEAAGWMGEAAAKVEEAAGWMGEAAAKVGRQQAGQRGQQAVGGRETQEGQKMGGTE